VLDGTALCRLNQLVHRTLPVVGPRADHHRAIAGLVSEWEAEIVVVGVPYSLDGSIGPAAQAVLEEIAVLTEALAWAAELAHGAVVAQGLAKQAVDGGLDRTLADGLSLEQDLFEDVFRTDDASIGVKSFLESGPGKATFGGR